MSTESQVQRACSVAGVLVAPGLCVVGSRPSGYHRSAGHQRRFKPVFLPVSTPTPLPLALTHLHLVILGLQLKPLEVPVRQEWVALVVPPTPAFLM